MCGADAFAEHSPHFPSISWLASISFQEFEQPSFAGSAIHSGRSNRAVDVVRSGASDTPLPARRSRRLCGVDETPSRRHPRRSSGFVPGRHSRRWRQAPWGEFEQPPRQLRVDLRRLIVVRRAAGNRRYLVIAARSGQGLLTESIAGAQVGRRNWSSCPFSVFDRATRTA